MNTLFFFYNNFQNSFEINYNIFDTNVINLVIVLIIVIKFLGEAVFNTLEQRKQEISMNLQNSNRKVLIVNEKLNPVEPYKAKGITEKGQFILRKEGKKK